MAQIFLEFHGTRGGVLPAVLLLCVSASLAAWGAWQLWLGRRRYGSVSLAAAAGPVAAFFAVAADAAVQRIRGAGQAARTSAIVAAILAALSIATLALASGGGQRFWLALLAGQAALAVGVFYVAVYSALGASRLALLVLLRTAGILALLLILFKPAVHVAADRADTRPYLPIVVDRSQSMSVADGPNLPSRYEQCLNMLLSQRGRIERHFRPVWYNFAETALPSESLDALAQLEPKGEWAQSTNIAAAIRRPSSDFPAARLAGLVLITDGIHNTSDIVLDAAVEAGVPVYALGVGSSEHTPPGLRNIRLVSADAPLEAVVDNVATVTARVEITGMSAVPADVRLMDTEDETVLDAERIWTEKDSDTISVEMKWTPRGVRNGNDGGDARANIRRLRVVIPEHPQEAIAEDNHFDLHVLVTEPRIRVLLVEGSMRPEYKYLRRLLDSDPNVEFMALVRVAENRFWAQGSIGGQRLDRLPATEDDFRLFDVIIIGDLDRTFWTREQLERLRTFVADGGGLLMLGGQNTFGPGGYGRTPLEEAMPVVMGDRSQPQDTTAFVPRLTAEGEAHPIFESITDYYSGIGREADPDLPELPELRGCVTVVSAKPGASLLAVHPDRRNEHGPLVVLAAQRFGTGRSAAFTADTTWQWYLPLRGLGADSPYERFWGQLTRWLANVETRARETGSAVLARLDRCYVESGEEVRLLGRIQDQQGRPAVDAQVSATIRRTEAEVGETLPLSPIGAGIYELRHRPAEPGTYTVTLSADDADGAHLGEDELDLTAAAHSEEMARLARNDILLELIADRSRGRAADLSALPEIIDHVADRHREPAADDETGDTYRLYDFTLLFLLFVGLVTVEWFVRRGSQLH